jgi:penicillin G amidase
MVQTIRRAGVRRSLVVAALVVTAAALSPAGVTASAPRRPRLGVTTETVGRGAERAAIVRDSYGVPSVYARAMPGVWFGAGWAQAGDRLVQLELTRRTVEGTLSEIVGPSELAQDEDVRTFFYTPAELAAQERSLPADMRRALQAFADGINGYEDLAYASLANERRLVPYEFWTLGQLLGLGGPYRPAPWTPADTVAVGNYLAREFGGGGGSELSNLAFLRYLQAELRSKGDAQATTDATAIFNDSRWIDDPTAPTTVPGPPWAHAATRATPARTGRAGRGAIAPAGSASSAAPDAKAGTAATSRSMAAVSNISGAALSQAGAALARDRRQILATGISLKVLAHGGSNGIAVAPWRSRDGSALLWGAPQEGFGTPSIDGEEYLHAPGYDAGGMDITGEPFVLIGRNPDVAWTTTSEELVDQRVYVEKVDFSSSPPTYLYDGRWVPMQAIQEQIPVAGAAPQPFTVYRTVDGPVFSTDPSQGIAFSIRFASFGRETGTLTGFAQLGRDRDLAQFEHSMSLLTTMHNFLYADRWGNIAYFGDGLIPIEPPFSRVDPRLPALGDGSEQWQGYVPFDRLPHSINPAQGFLDNWNTKPSQRFFYQQNSGDEYWGTIFRSQRIAQLLAASTRIDIPYLERIEHDIGTIDNGDNTRPAAPYFIPFVVRAYNRLVAAHDPIVDPATHPDLAQAVRTLADWDDYTTLGSPAMSIFMNFLEALERNVFEGGTFPGEQYTGAVNFSDGSLGMGTYGGLGGYATYNFLYHILAHVRGIVPCGTLCYSGDYFAGHRDQILVQSVNDAIAILSGTGTQLGQNVPGFGTPDISAWGYEPAQDTDWDSLDPLAAGVHTNCGTSASQNRSTYMQAIDMRPPVVGVNVLPPGQSGFISAAGVPSPHLCDQVGLFDSFTYKPMPPAR